MNYKKYILLFILATTLISFFSLEWVRNTLFWNESVNIKLMMPLLAYSVIAISLVTMLMAKEIKNSQDNVSFKERLFLAWKHKICILKISFLLAITVWMFCKITILSIVWGITAIASMVFIIRSVIEGGDRI